MARSYAHVGSVDEHVRPLRAMFTAQGITLKMGLGALGRRFMRRSG